MDSVERKNHLMHAALIVEAFAQDCLNPRPELIELARRLREYANQRPGEVTVDPFPRFAERLQDRTRLDGSNVEFRVLKRDREFRGDESLVHVRMRWRPCSGPDRIYGFIYDAHRLPKVEAVLEDFRKILRKHAL